MKHPRSSLPLSLYPLPPPLPLHSPLRFPSLPLHPPSLCLLHSSSLSLSASSSSACPLLLHPPIFLFLSMLHSILLLHSFILPLSSITTYVFVITDIAIVFSDRK